MSKEEPPSALGVDRVPAALRATVEIPDTSQNHHVWVKSYHLPVAEFPNHSKCNSQRKRATLPIIKANNRKKCQHRPVSHIEF